MILDETEIENTASWVMPGVKNSGFFVYWLIIILFLAGLISTFFIQVDISTRVNGIIRPLDEKICIRSPISGIINTIYYREGDKVANNSLLFELRDSAIEIRAPVSGTLRELNVRFPGKSVQAGEIICTLNTSAQLMGECFVSSKDIGFLRTGQSVKFQFDAFNYVYFGTGSGIIYSIDSNYILLNNIPLFKVTCTLNERTLRLTNGYVGELRKGMSFQARFITCNRSLWQLLYDRLDDWLNPVRQPVLKKY